MFRVTGDHTLSDERHRALKEAAARRNTSIGRIIEESLESYGIKASESASALVAVARERSGLVDDDVMAVAVEETRIERFREDPKRVSQQQLDRLLLEGLDSGPAEPWTEADVDGIRSAVRETLAKRRRAHGADTQD